MQIFVIWVYTLSKYKECANNGLTQLVFLNKSFRLYLPGGKKITMHVNNAFQRNSNLSRVFETVWKNPNFSRIDIARKLELYRSTVSNIIGTLVDSGLICEGERGLPTEKGGRKPVFLSITTSLNAPMLVAITGF